jgi:hypothetical protein
VEGERVAFSAPQPKRKQEPVASIYISPSGERELDDWRVELPVGRNLLYTAPQPKREWVGLTDEEIVHVTGHCGVSIIAATTVYRAIEPKLREKNGGGV